MLPLEQQSTRRGLGRHLARSALAVLPLLAVPPSGQAQAPAWVTESGLAARFDDVWGRGEVLTATFGRVVPVSARIGVGAVVQGGVSVDMYAAVGPRVRIQAGPDLAIALTPLVRLSSGHPMTGRAWLDAGLMHRDAVGLGLSLHQVDQVVSLDHHPWSGVARAQPVVTAGLRLGSRPGRVGAGAMVVAMLVAGFTYAASGP